MDTVLLSDARVNIDFNEFHITFLTELYHIPAKKV